MNKILEKVANNKEIFDIVYFPICFEFTCFPDIFNENINVNL